MPDALSYADAVRLLGGEKSRVVDWFDKLTGGALLAASVPVPALLGIFDAKAEFVRLGHELVRGVSEKRSGLSRYHRTQRLEAAHAVIAVTAFFEVMSEIDLPFDVASARISKAEQLSLAGSGAVHEAALTDAFFATAAPLPGPQLPYPAFRHSLVAYYGGLVGRLLHLLRGLAAWEAVEEWRRQATEEMLLRLPRTAADRHRDLLTQLAVDYVEVAFWIGLHEHEATRTQVRALSVGLDEMRQALVALSAGSPPDGRRAALAVAYSAELGRPIISSGDVPTGLTVPTLGEAYVPPLCRIEELPAHARPSDEAWWDGRPLRDDLWQSLVVHLTSPNATRAPLLVLGQPGSGKSVLTRVLAAQLPAADFMVVRVVLRDVHAAGELQDQIEQAVRNDTGERVDWPGLSRSAGDALPVVLLDGFDELLQATGVSQTDYLRRVAAFQRREADQGRPVAVLVTSRTSVADRAQPPPGTVAVRLEPFDGERVRAWTATWNRVNAGAFRALGVQPLEPATVLAHRELAEQPLLLLMLALYDAEGNDLRSAGELGRGELYERLLRSFARREVMKHRPGLSERDLDRATEDELRRLSIVAFGMFNRGVQWVTENGFESDLAALPFLGSRPAAVATDGHLRTPLRPAEIVLGRFFFVHRSQAMRDESRASTYEFLHATFGEFLIARTTALVLDDLAAREASALLGATPTDDDPLHALLSFATLTGRTPIVTFLTEILTSWGESRRDAVVDLLLRLFRAAPDRRPARRFESYEPRQLSVPARHAVYGVNLLVLLLAARGQLRASELHPDSGDVASGWNRLALFWRSQLSDSEYAGLLGVVRVERAWTGTRRDLLLSIGEGRDESPPPTGDPGWFVTGSRDDSHSEVDAASYYLTTGTDFALFARTAHFECDPDLDTALHALGPLGHPLDALGGFWTFPDGDRSEARLLLDVSLLPILGAGARERERAYQRLLAIVEEPDETPQLPVAEFVLDRISTDPGLSAAFVADVLCLLQEDVTLVGSLLASAARCVLTFLGRDRETDVRLAEQADRLIAGAQWFAAAGGSPLDWLDTDTAELVARTYEAGVRRYPVSVAEAASFRARHGSRRPDLVHRLIPLTAPSEERSGRKHRQDGVADGAEADS
ncbi:NACHT domain-containing protein [Micromonospora sp. SD12]|uniref:NACHT domain-containing protein n=1 Tax=Micromonospora sp. SD12 TaxID=3452216 RepID=UPI003F8CDB76